MGDGHSLHGQWEMGRLPHPTLLQFKGFLFVDLYKCGDIVRGILIVRGVIV